MWEDIQFHIVDTPQSQVKLEQRMEILSALERENHRVVQYQQLGSLEQLLQELEENEREGNYDLVFKKPASYYYEKSSFLEVSSFRKLDAHVLNYSPKHGYLQCELYVLPYIRYYLQLVKVIITARIIIYHLLRYH